MRVTQRNRMKPINKNMAKLINQRNELQKKTKLNCKKCKNNIIEKHKCKEDHEMNENKVKLIEQDISDIEAKENRELIIKNFKSFNDNPEEVNLGQI